MNAKWGNLQAILAGDFLLSRASEIAASLGTEVAGLLARTLGWLCEGEIEQLRHTYDVQRPEESYFASIQGKTASLYGTAARIGGIVAGLDRPTIDGLTEWGTAFGMVFQIVDDILDITDSTEQLGKPAGHDLVEGVYTLPVLRTLTLGRSVGEELAALLGRPLDVAERDKALAIVRANEGVASAAATARRYVAAAEEACDDLPPGPATAALRAAPPRSWSRRPSPRSDPSTAFPGHAGRCWPLLGWRLVARSRTWSLGLRRQADDRGGGLVGGFGRAELVGAQEVGHDPQHPLHQRAAVHAGPGELAHQRRAADHPGEQPGHLEVLAVLVVEQLRVALQRRRVAGGQRLVDDVGGHAPRLVGVVDALTVERVDAAGGVADDEVRRAGLGPTEPPIGMRPLTGRASGRSASISHRSATWWA